METRIRCIFLKLLSACALLVLAQVGLAEQDADIKVEKSSPLIEPHILRLDLDEADIDTENFEVGLHWGRISIEDFGVNDVIAATLAYHVSEDLFVELTYGDSEMQPLVAEEFIPNFSLSADSALDYNYYNISLGYNVLPGEVFVWKDWAFNSQIYVIAGVGVTEHLDGAKDTTLTLGLGYRLIVWDWLAFHVDFRDHIFERQAGDLAEAGVLDNEMVDNFEARGGVSIFF